LSGILVYRLDEHRKNEFRCHVQDDLLQPGMTRVEVEHALSQFGKFQSSESHFPGGFLRLRIIYEDRATYFRFGGDFVFEFVDDEFLGVWLPSGVGETRAFCEHVKPAVAACCLISYQSPSYKTCRRLK